MRWILVLLMAGIAAPAGAADASKFDGTYKVSIPLQDGFDGPNCPKYEIASLRVEMGQIQTGPEQSMIAGTIDDRGRLQGRFLRTNFIDLPFRGSLKTDKNDPNAIQIKATIIDDRSGCGWALSLVRE